MVAAMKKEDELPSSRSELDGDEALTIAITLFI
jgi:hypothetical protein